MTEFYTHHQKALTIKDFNNLVKNAYKSDEMHYQIMFVVTTKIKCTELQSFEDCIPEYYIDVKVEKFCTGPFCDMYDDSYTYEINNEKMYLTGTHNIICSFDKYAKLKIDLENKLEEEFSEIDAISWDKPNIYVTK